MKNKKKTRKKPKKKNNKYKTKKTEEKKNSRVCIKQKCFGALAVTWRRVSSWVNRETCRIVYSVFIACIHINLEWTTQRTSERETQYEKIAINRFYNSLLPNSLPNSSKRSKRNNHKNILYIIIYVYIC